MPNEIDEAFDRLSILAPAGVTKEAAEVHELRNFIERTRLKDNRRIADALERIAENSGIVLTATKKANEAQARHEG